MEASPGKGGGQRMVGAKHRGAVSLLDGHFAQCPFTYSQSQCVSGRLQQCRVVGPGQQRLSAPLDVQRERSIDQ
jgi:hypothetical protein